MTPKETFYKHMHFRDNKNMAINIARKYFIPGVEQEDIKQEALLYLWEACLKIESNNECEITAFCKKYIENRLLYLKRSNFRNRPGDERVWVDIDQVLFDDVDPYEMVDTILDNPAEWDDVLNDRDIQGKQYLVVTSFELLKRAQAWSERNDEKTLQRYVVKWLSLLMFGCKSCRLGKKQKNEINIVLRELKLDTEDGIKWNKKRLKQNHDGKSTKIELYS